jgi:hypothetical protein
MLALQLLRAAAQIDLRADLASRHADLQDRPSPRGTDSAQNYLALIEHREFNDHPIEVGTPGLRLAAAALQMLHFGGISLCQV